MEHLLFAAADPEGWAAMSALVSPLLLLLNLAVAARSLWGKSASQADLDRVEEYARTQAHALRDAAAADRLRLAVLETQLKGSQDALARVEERLEENAKLLARLAVWAEQQDRRNSDRGHRQ